MKELTADELRQWKRIVVDVLRELHDICHRNGFTYYAVGGTAIGAVRHKGMIPWDDDIDVAMPRPDFDRFVEYCRTHDLGNYELVTPYGNDDYNLSFPKFCNRNTTLVERWDTPCVIGLFVDVFPLDATSDDRDEVQRLVRRYIKLRNRLEAITTHNTFSEYMALLKTRKEWGRFVVKTVGFFFRKRMRTALLRQMNGIFRKYEYGTTGSVINYGGAYGMKELFDKKILEGKAVNLPFEDVTIDMMPGYDAYLHGVYGDYMQLPPEEKRIAHHLKAFFDFSARVNPFA